MKIEGTFKGHTTGGYGAWAGLGVLIVLIGAGLIRDGSGITRAAGHAAEIFLIAAVIFAAVVLTATVALVIIARRHEARWMAERANRDTLPGHPAQLPYERRAAPPSAARREIHVYHHLDGLPRSVAESPVTAEILNSEVTDGEWDR